MNSEFQAALAKAISENSVAVSNSIQALITAMELRDLKKLVYPECTGRLAKDLLVRNRPASLKNIVVYNGGGATRYLQVHDKAGKAGEGERPAHPPLVC